MEKIEITDEMLDFVASGKCGECLCEGCICQKLCASTPRQLKEIFARALKSERAERAKNPGVWGVAPEWATDASIVWSAKKHYPGVYKTYTRELPKTKAREIAEKAWGKLHTNIKDDLKESDIQTIESAILEALADKK